jgi:hypothetical protein
LIRSAQPTRHERAISNEASLVAAAWPPLAGEHALPGVLGSDPGERDAGVDSELLEGVAEVSADGVRGDVEPLGDLFISEALATSLTTASSESVNAAHP